jgi:acyl-coenzyme A synthetase/AMP-(fatty) acid ligase
MNWITQRFQRFGERSVAVGEDGATAYADFTRKIEQCRETLREWGVVTGDRVGLVADYHVDTVALMLALLDTGCIVIPLSGDDRSLFDERLKTACANKVITAEGPGAIDLRSARCRSLASADSAVHPLLENMISSGTPGLVIFTSGSTSKEKAVLLDYARMTRACRERLRESLRTLLFLRLDHIGGLNTLFRVIFNGGTIVTCPSRQAADICACIERHAVELLPTTPSFLTMLLMSGVHAHYDLSSLKVISYGTEVMPNSTLAGLHRAFPGVTLKQTYGLSELGILDTKSRDSSSKWMKIGGEGIELDVRGGTLWIRSDRAMLGYLNAPSPFDPDGWYDTGDRVEVDGEYFQILGRESEVINVAGEKVFPAEVESFLLTLGNVKDVVVRRKRSPVVGQMVWAEFLLEEPEDPASFRKRVIEQCQRHLAPFKVPGLVTIAATDSLVGSRFKKIRKSGTDSVAA